MVERTLNMKFKNVAGGSFTYDIKDIKDGVEDLDVKAAMDSIITDNIFTTKGGELVSKISAEIVVKDTTEITL